MSAEEKTPAIKISMGNQEYMVTPENSSVWWYLGELAMYNHVFMVVNEGEVTEDGSQTLQATHIFQQLQPVAYKTMVPFMLQNKFAAHINLRAISDIDVQAYERTLAKLTADIGDDFPSFPEEWDEPAA